MWILDILENTLNVWNSTLTNVWAILTESPQTFHNGAVWLVITKIFTALQGAGYGLLVLFFAVDIFKHTTSFREFRHPEQVLRYFIRFVMAKASITYSMSIIKGIFTVTGGFVSTVKDSLGTASQIAATLPENIREAVEGAGILDKAFVYLVALLMCGIVIVLSITILMKVYMRFFKIYMFVALAPIPTAAFAGETTSRHGRTFVQAFVGACMEALVIALACIIFTAFASDGSDLPTFFGESSAGLIIGYMLNVIVQMVILTTLVSTADHVVKEMMGL